MKRNTWKRAWIVLAGITLIALLLLVWGFLIEPNQLVLHSETIVLPHWPREFDGLRVAVLSDIHAGSPFIDTAKLNQIVRQTNETHPDVILLLGDLMVKEHFYKHPLAPEIIAAALQGLHARLGVYAVLGNHDWWFNGPRVQLALTKAHITVIENDVVQIQSNGSSFFLLGISDLWTRPQNIAETVQRIPSGTPVIAITHNPDIFPAIPESVALTLAGHTHGGQINIPFVGRPVVPSRFGQRYAAGLIQEGSKKLFVTTGIGTSIIPVRFRVPPEIVILILKAA
jgi:predicted MPP superfamily phosphohydrolase